MPPAQNERGPRAPTLLDAIVPVVVLIGLIGVTIWLFGVSATDGPLHVALLLSAAFAALVALLAHNVVELGIGCPSGGGRIDHVLEGFRGRAGSVSPRSSGNAAAFVAVPDARGLVRELRRDAVGGRRCVAGGANLFASPLIVVTTVVSMTGVRSDPGAAGTPERAR